MSIDQPHATSDSDKPRAKSSGPPWRFQYSLRTLMLLFVVMGGICWYVRQVNTVENDTLINAPWADASKRRHYMGVLKEQTDDQLEASLKADFNATARDESFPDTEACLIEIVRRSSAGNERWSRVLHDLMAASPTPERFFGRFDPPATNLQLLTTRRRVNREPDPLVVEVNGGSEFTCVLPDRPPAFQIRLANRDIKKQTFVLWPGGDYRSGRSTKFSMEVNDEAGGLVPVCERWMGGGGLSGPQPLKPGDSIPYDLSLDDYVTISRPGSFSARVLYHPCCCIADEGHTVGMIVYRSESIRVVVRIPAVQINQASHAEARRWIAELPATGPIILLYGRYGAWLKDQIPPETAAGHLLNMGFRAVPDLLAELRQPSVDNQRRGWMLALLFSITGCNDPIPKGDFGQIFQRLFPSMHIWTVSATPSQSSGGGGVGYAVQDGGTFPPIRADRDNVETANCQREFAHRWDGWEKYLPPDETDP